MRNGDREGRGISGGDEEKGNERGGILESSRFSILTIKLINNSTLDGQIHHHLSLLIANVSMMLSSSVQSKISV